MKTTNGSGSRSRRATQALLLVAVFAKLPVCGAATVLSDAQERAAYGKMSRKLAAKGDADSLAAAALLTGTWLMKRDSALDLIKRATALEPGRADLAWLQMTLCRDFPSCEAAPLEAKLRALDPSNGATSVAAFERASRANDAPAMTANLAALAESDRVNFYWSPLVRSLTLAVQRAGGWSEERALWEVIGLLTGEVFPPFGALSKACNGTELDRPGRQDACRGIARALRAGDTYVGVFVGLRIAERAAGSASDEARQIQEIRRVQRYRLHESGRLNLDAIERKGHAAEYLDDLARFPNEPDLAVAELRRANRPLDPPPDDGKSHD